MDESDSAGRDPALFAPVGEALWLSARHAVGLLRERRLTAANSNLAAWFGPGRWRDRPILLEEDSDFKDFDGLLWRATDLPGGPREFMVCVSPAGENGALELALFHDAARLRESGLRIAAVEESVSGFTIVSPEGRFLYANRAYLRMTGYDNLEEILGRSAAEHHVEAESVRRILDDLDRQGQCTVEFEARRKDGSTFDVLMVARRAIDGRGRTVYFGTQIDVTARNRLRAERERFLEQIGEVKRLEATGRLAAGVAHDFNNKLSPILGYAEILIEDLAENDALRGFAEEIREAALRSRDLTRQLLAVSRAQVLGPRPVDLRDVVRRLEGLLARALREKVELKIFLPETPCVVEADPGELDRVVMNLAVNAQDAMPDGGVLTIEIEERELDEAYCAGKADVAPGRFGVLAVSDTGVGMDEATRQRVFEPFFTTKGPAGTGLGLATVYGIVKQHGGNIWVYSEPGQGSTFKAFFPLSDRAPADPKPVQKTATRGGAGRTILVVEDDDMVRGMAERLLTRAGYRVIAAERGAAALGAIDSLERPLDLLLTDVVMPDMSGRELAERAAERLPRLKTLYMSGYTKDVIARHGVIYPGIRLVQKPFSTQELIEAVRAAIEGQDPVESNLY